MSPPVGSPPPPSRSGVAPVRVIATGGFRGPRALFLIKTDSRRGRMFGWMPPTLHGNRVTPLIRGRGHTGVVVIDYPGDLQILGRCTSCGTA